MLGFIFSKNNMTMLLYITLSLTMIFTRGSDLSQSIRQGGVSVLGGVQVGMSTGFSWLGQLATEAVEIWRMRDLYQRMQQRIVNYGFYEIEAHRLKLENEELRRQLGMPLSIGYRQVHAEVVARDASNLMHGFFINKGEYSGLQPKMLVLAYNADSQRYGVVGRIQEVFAYSAKVVPLNHPDFFLAVKILPSGYEGLIENGSWSGDTMIVNYLSRNALLGLSVGDTAVTSRVQGSEEEESPVIDNLYVGEVSRIIDDPTLASLRVELRSVIDLGRIQSVFVLLPEAESRWVPRTDLRSEQESSVYQEYYQEQEAAGLPRQSPELREQE
jgi:rod shape-determining protein MreC